MYRRCESCGANLDAGEICDCKKEVASSGANTESDTENTSTDNLPNNIEKVKE